MIVINADECFNAILISAMNSYECLKK